MLDKFKDFMADNLNILKLEFNAETHLNPLQLLYLVSCERFTINVYIHY